MEISIQVAEAKHNIYADEICELYKESAKVRGTGIATRKPEYIIQKMNEGKSIIALDGGNVVGFCYIENWEDTKYVANSGLIIKPDYRKTGLAKKIKKATFNLSKQKYPNAKLFGITTSLAVMKINSDLGYKPVTFSELTQDEKFWAGCQNCVNYDILQRTERKLCLCTGMVCDLSKVVEKKEATGSTEKKEKRKKSAWKEFKDFMSLRKIRLNKKLKQYPSIQKKFENEK